MEVQAVVKVQDGPRNVFEAARSGRDFRPAAAAAPCEARPGTAEKIAVLRARLEAGQDLWSEGDDAGEDRPPVPARTAGPKRSFVDG